MGDELIDALERVWHLALSRAQDKEGAVNRADPEDVADVLADGSALQVIQDWIEAMGGRV